MWIMNQDKDIVYPLFMSGLRCRANVVVRPSWNGNEHGRGIVPDDITFGGVLLFTGYNLVMRRPESVVRDAMAGCEWDDCDSEIILGHFDTREEVEAEIRRLKRVAFGERDGGKVATGRKRACDKTRDGDGDGLVLKVSGGSDWDD